MVCLFACCAVLGDADVHRCCRTLHWCSRSACCCTARRFATTSPSILLWISRTGSHACGLTYSAYASRAAGAEPPLCRCCIRQTPLNACEARARSGADGRQALHAKPLSCKSLTKFPPTARSERMHYPCRAGRWTGLRGNARHQNLLTACPTPGAAVCKSINVVDTPESRLPRA